MEKIENNFINSYQNGNFLDYLKNNGKYKQILKTVRKLEKKSESFCLNNFLTKNERVIYEIPTDELCSVLAMIFKNQKMVEVGAGLGLLSARLKEHYGLDIMATSKFDNTFKIKHKYNFTKVSDISFEEIGQIEDIANKIIIISWLHSSHQKDFIKMIKKNNPTTIVHVGEHEGSCYDEKFIPKLQTLGYKFIYLLSIKQISKVDYFIDDKIRNKNTTRTCTTVFSKNKIDILEEDYKTKLGPEKFGEYKYCDGDYAKQDLTNPRINDIDSALLNIMNNNNLSPLTLMHMMMQMYKTDNDNDSAPLNIMNNNNLSPLTLMYMMMQMYKTDNDNNI